MNAGLCYGNVYLDILGTPGDTCGYIEELVRQNYVEKDMRYFSPYAPISRAEVIRMLAYAFRLQAGNISHGYNDTAMLGNTINTAIQSLYERRCIHPASALMPLALIPRGEAYKLTACVLGL